MAKIRTSGRYWARGTLAVAASTLRRLAKPVGELAKRILLVTTNRP